MIPLVRFLTGHLAPHHSPTRERREARFAGATGGSGNAGNPLDKDKDSNPAPKSLESQNPPESGAEGAGNTIESIQSESARAKEVTGIDLPAVNSQDVAENLIYLHRIPQKRLKEVGDSIVISESDFAEIRKSISHPNINGLAAEVAAHDVTVQALFERVNTADMYLFDWVCKHCPPSLKQRFLEMLAPDIDGQLETNPEVTLQSAREIGRQIEKFERLREQLEQLMQIDERIKKIVELERDLLETQDKKLDESARQMIEGKIEQEERLMRQSIMQPASALGKKLEKVFDKHIKNLEQESGTTLSPEERTDMCLDAVLEIKRNAEKKLRESRNFGGKSDPQSAQEYPTPDTTLDRLRKQEKGLRIILDAQLQKRARFIYTLHAERLNRIIERLQIEGVRDIADVQAVLRDGGDSVFGKKPGETTDPAKREAEQRAQALEAAFLGKYGVSVVTFLTQFDQLHTYVLRQYRVPPEDVMFRRAFPELINEKQKDTSLETHYTVPPGPNDPPDPDATLNFLDSAAQDIAKWDKREQDVMRAPDDPASVEPDLAVMQQDQVDTEKWAFTMADLIQKLEEREPNRAAWTKQLEAMKILLPVADREQFVTAFDTYVDVLRNYVGKDTPESRAQLRTQLDKCVTPATFPPAIQQQIGTFLALLGNPQYLQYVLDEAKGIEEQALSEIQKGPVNETIKRICTDTRRNLDEVIGTLIPARPNAEANDTINRHDLCKPLQHEISACLNIGSVLIGKKVQLHKQMEAAEESEDRDTALRSALRAQAEVERLLLVARYLDEIERNVVDDEATTGNVPAEYVRDEHKIRINPRLRGTAEFESALQHERGHAILHIFTERTKLFPNLLGVTFDAHKNVTNEKGETFEQLLYGIKDVGSYERFKDLNPKAKQDGYTEELLIRYADWKAERDRRFHRNELQLFDMLETGQVRPLARGDMGRRLEELQNLGDLSRFQREHASALDDDEEQRKHTFNMKEQLTEIARALNNVKQFLGAYKKKESTLPRDIYETIFSYHHSAEQGWKSLNAKFTDRTNWTGGIPPEETKEDRELCVGLGEYAGKLEKTVQEIDVDKLDTTKEQRDVGIWEQLTRGIALASINDVVKFCTDTWEDVKTMHQRRQDQLLKDVGYALTKPLQDSDLIKNIPGVRNYLPTLHSYHQQRYSRTETEAPEKWKEGMKNEDSHSLLHFLHYTDNKDAVRGIISLLCDRGEMDWNDTGVWRTLKKLSGYNMPEGPCSRSDVLRDTWLRKIVSYIWRDKELYYHWRAENDSKTKSGMDHFQAWVDQLSNVGGGMRAELQKQLRLQMEWNEYGKSAGIMPPEDIKPHLYEKVIHYAIDMGKMSMEDKLYYLVRGVESGILSIDRLRTMAGAEGGVLNQFPFIDYFYGRNNTMPEIRALAGRLAEEGADGKDTFKPGAKTTLWIQLEVVRDSHVQQRVSKATSGTRAESIDHEDVPLLLPQLNFNAVRNMSDVVSGSRQKMSPEGLKNLYCGYSGKFKVFGRLAQLDDQEHLERFSMEDADNLAEAITAYIDYDNIITLKARDKETYASLTESQLRTGAPSAEGGFVVMDYRRNLNKFVARLVNRLRGDIEGTDKWKAFLSESYRAENPATGTKEKKYSLEQWVNLDENNAEKVEYNKKEDAASLSLATKYFLEALKQVLRNPENLRILKETLKEFTLEYDDKGGSDKDGFIDQYGSVGQLTLENTKRSILARNAARDKVYGAQNGNGHH